MSKQSRCGGRPFFFHEPPRRFVQVASKSPPRSMARENMCVPNAEMPDSGRDEAIAKMWSFYTEKVYSADEETIEAFKSDADGILVITGLFAGTVATFLVDSYKSLLPDPNDTIIAQLARISAQLDGTPIAGPLLPPFQPSNIVVRVNVLWFISLCLSLSIAFIAVLTQTWCRRYLQLCKRPQTTPELQARIRVFLFDGVERYKMEVLVGIMPSVLHAAVLFFLIGFADLLFPINVAVATTVLVFLALIFFDFLAFTISPLVHLASPYSTPFSWILWRLLSVSLNYIYRGRSFPPTLRSDDTRPHGLWASLRNRFKDSPRDAIKNNITSCAVLPSELRILVTAVSDTLRTPPDVASFFDGLALALGASSAPAKAAIEVLTAGRACLLSATRVLLPHAGQNISSWLKLCFALQRAAGKSVLRDNLFPDYVQPVMSPLLKSALERQPLYPEPHLAVTARVFLAYSELKKLREGTMSSQQGSSSYEQKIAMPGPYLTSDPEPPVQRTRGVSVALALVEDALQLWPTMTFEDRPVSIGMVADCVGAAVDMPFDGNSAIMKVYQRIADNLRRVAEGTKEGEYDVLMAQMDRMRTRLGISDAPPGHIHAPTSSQTLTQGLARAMA